MTQNEKKKQSVTDQPTDRPTDQPTNQPINRPTKRVIDLCARDLKTTAQQYLRLSYIATTYNTKQKDKKDYISVMLQTEGWTEGWTNRCINQLTNQLHALD